MKTIFMRWVALTLAILLVSQVPFLGIRCDHWTDAAWAALFLSAANAFVRPVLILVALPLIVLSLGLFILVLNALLLWAVTWLVDGFHIAGFWSAVGGSLVISFVSFLFGGRAGHVRVQSFRRDAARAPSSNDRDDGQGPVIDI